MQHGAAFLNHLRRLVADDSITIGILAAVAFATILAFGFDATADIVASILVVGVTTAFAEARLRATK